MEEMTNVNNNELICNSDVMSVTESMLSEVRRIDDEKNKISIPLAELSTLGTGISELLPAFRTVTETMSMDSSGLFRIMNATDGTLKMAKGGKFAWGALKAADGSSKMAKLQAVSEVTGKSVATLPINPATIMMTAALYSVEKQMKSIEAMEKNILSLMEFDKEAEIEADLITVSNVIHNYKLSWDNETYVTNNHKLIEDIQRTARKHVISYQKQVDDALKNKNLVVVNGAVNSTQKTLYKKFQYYRLALYTFSMASFSEIMLGGNYKEEYINGIRSEIEKMSLEYGDYYTKCSDYLEHLSGLSVENNVVKGLSKASDAVGKFIGKIPKVKDGQVDEFLIDSGEKMLQGVHESQNKLMSKFSEIQDSVTKLFTDTMQDMIQIYNHTEEVCFDGNNLYLVAG